MVGRWILYEGQADHVCEPVHDIGRTIRQTFRLTKPVMSVIVII